MKRKSYFVLVALVSLASLYSCTKDKTAIPAGVNCGGITDSTNTFNKNIYPNITGVYCAYSPCHAGGSAGGGVDMSTYASTVSAFENSTVICAITNTGCELMPKGGPALDTALIRQLKCWQASGYPE
jgi:hypothetical protein